MNANQMNAKALANTAREVIAMCDNKKFTVAKIIAHWNLCVEQSGFTGTFDCPTCYKRKASIVGDMERIALQLDRIADDRDPLTGDSIHANDPRCDDEGNDPREWCGNDIEAAHTAALQANGWIDSLTCSKAGADAAFFQMIEGDHAEALKDDCAIETACKVIAAMRGCDVLEIMPGICGGMYRDGISEIMQVSDIALSVARNRAHAEALEMDAQRDIDALVMDGGALQTQIDFYALPCDSERAALVEKAHGEALATDLVIYLGAAVADGAAYLDGWVLRHPSGFYYDHNDKRQINPLKATYFTPKEKHLLGQFVTLYGMEAMSLGSAVMRSLEEARAAING